MKKTVILLLAICVINFAAAQTAPSFCDVVTKILMLGNKDKLVELKGAPVDRDIYGAEKYYKSTLALPGFTDPEIRERYQAGCWFAAHILYDNKADMLNTFKATQQQIQDCLAATKQKFELTDNSVNADIWWQCQKVRIGLHYYVSGKIYVVNISFDPPF